MIRLFLRILQRTWAARRGDEAWLRMALSGGEALYLYGVVDAVAGAALTDRGRPPFPVDLWGNLSSPGLPQGARLRLRMTSGVATGTAWEINSVTDGTISLDGVADLVLAGVASGDTYHIEDPDHDDAVGWFARVNLRFSKQFPADHAALPSVVVRQGGRSADRFFIGGVWGERQVVNNEVTELLTVMHRNTLSAAAMAVSEEEAQWIEAFVLAAMMEYARAVSTLFAEGFQWSITGVNQVQAGNLECFGSELTLSGQCHHLQRDSLPSVVTEDGLAAVNHAALRGGP